MCTMWKQTSRTVLDTELHIIPQGFTERRMERRQKRKRQGNPERWKVQRRKRRKPWESKRLGKERTTSQRNHRTTSGQVDLGDNGQNNLGTQMIGTQQIRILRTSAAAEEFQHASVCDLRLSNLGFVQHIECFQHERLDPSQRTITFGTDTAACKNCCSCHSPCSTWVFGPQKTPYLDVRTALLAETKCMIKERGYCAPWMRQESQWPSRAEKSTVDDPGWRSPR